MRFADYAKGVIVIIGCGVLLGVAVRLFERSPFGALPEWLQGLAFIGVLFVAGILAWVFWRGLKTFSNLKDSSMPKRPQTHEFRVVRDQHGMIEVIFGPTNSTFDYYPTGTYAQHRHAGTGDAGEYEEAELMQIANELAAKEARRNGPSRA